MLDRDALFRVFRNIIAMNRDSVWTDSIFEYEQQLPKSDLEFGHVKNFSITESPAPESIKQP